MLHYLLTAMLLILGVLTHWLKAFSTARRAQALAPISARDYWFKFWPESMVVLFSAVAGYLFLMESGNLSYVNSFGIGFIANSLADLVGNRVQAMIATVPTPTPKDGSP